MKLDAANIHRSREAQNSVTLPLIGKWKKQIFLKLQYKTTCIGTRFVISSVINWCYSLTGLLRTA
jgi:hypothetical protein